MNDASPRVPQLRSAVVLRVEEDSCLAWQAGAELTARYAPQFPTPHVERVFPGHLVAIAAAPDGRSVVLWRWYDSVVLGHETSGEVRLWEPAHGEVVAQPRASYERLDPGSRAYASAGLPGAEWWVASGVPGSPGQAPTVELDLVAALYTEYDMWGSALSG